TAGPRRQWSLPAPAQPPNATSALAAGPHPVAVYGGANPRAQDAPAIRVGRPPSSARRAARPARTSAWPALPGAAAVDGAVGPLAGLAHEPVLHGIAVHVGDVALDLIGIDQPSLTEVGMP